MTPTQLPPRGIAQSPEPYLWSALERRDPRRLEQLAQEMGVGGLLAGILHRHACMGLADALPHQAHPPFHLTWTLAGLRGVLDLWVTGPCEVPPLASVRGPGAGHASPSQANLGPLILQTDPMGHVNLTVPSGASPVTVFRNQKPWTHFSGRRAFEITLDPAEYHIECPAGTWQVEITRKPWSDPA